MYPQAVYRDIRKADPGSSVGLLHRYPYFVIPGAIASPAVPDNLVEEP
jgi:hypothetical protein